MGRPELPDGEPSPSASDCYRFVLSNSNVDVCITGPSNAAQFQEALNAWDRGPMDAGELARMHRVGEAKYARLGRFSFGR
jgi:predicted aldo/keto reductase-like oxidoreductase